jgi:hypothetical protein
MKSEFYNLSKESGKINRSSRAHQLSRCPVCSQEIYSVISFKNNTKIEEYFLLEKEDVKVETYKST